MKKSVINEPDRIARDYMIGNTRVRIAANYCDSKTPQEVRRILDRVSSIAVEALLAQAVREGRLPTREDVMEGDLPAES